MSTNPVAISGQFAGTPGVFRHSYSNEPYDMERSTARTVEAMARHIRYCASDPYIRSAAADALATWGKLPAGLAGLAMSDRARRAWAAWWWVKHNCRFVQDDDLLLSLLNESNQLELLITPSVMVRLEDRAGDCDDFTMLVCCLLEAMGVPWRILTFACDPRDRARWSHVCGAAVLETGELVALDASHGKYPGWRIPLERTYRFQVWDSLGRPSKESIDMNAIRGLHGYTSRPHVVPIRRRVIQERRRRGVGQDSADQGTTGSLSNVFTDIGLPADTNVGSSTVYSPPLLPSPAPATNAALTTAIANEAGALTRIFGQTLAPQTTIQSGPGGTLITGPSGAIAQTALPSISLGGGFNMNTLVLVAVIGIGGLILVKAVGK